MYDYLYFDPDLDNPEGVKSVIVNQKINNQWEEVARKEGNDLLNSEGQLLTSIRWPFRTFNWSNDFQIKSTYEDSEGNIHESYSYYSRPTDGSWRVNSTYDIDSFDSIIIQRNTTAISTVTDSNGIFTFDFTNTPITDSSYIITFTATDAAGNESIASEELNFIVKF